MGMYDTSANICTRKQIIRLMLGFEYFLSGTSTAVICVKVRRSEGRKRLGFGPEVGDSLVVQGIIR